MRVPVYRYERFCIRCLGWVKPYVSPAALYGITTYDEMCPSCKYAVNFSAKRLAVTEEAQP